jgi:hypothetical protein
MLNRNKAIRNKHPKRSTPPKMQPVQQNKPTLLLLRRQLHPVLQNET